MTIKPTDDHVTTCKGSRASSLLSTKVLYISTIAETDKCATKVCAYPGSLNNPFSSLDDAQEFYRTQEGAGTVLNPVTYLFTDNGTYGSPFSEYTLSPFENMVAQANNANLIGKFMVDGTGASGPIGQNFTGMNLVGNSTLTVENFVLGAQYFLTLKDMLISVNVDAPLTKDHGPTGVLNFEIGGGASVNLIANGLFMTNLGNADLVQFDGTDEANLGSSGTFSFDNFSATAVGGSCVNVQSDGFETMVATLSSNTALTSAGDSPTINISAENSQDTTKAPQSILFFNGGSFRSAGSGGVLNVNLGGAAKWTTNFSNSLIEAVLPMATTLQSSTSGSATSTLQISNSSVSARGTALDLQQDSTGSTTFVGSLVKIFHSDATDLPLVRLNATNGNLSWKTNFIQFEANNTPDTFGFIEDIGGTSNFSYKDSDSSFAQTGSDAHLFRLSQNDNANTSFRNNNGNFSANSGMVAEDKINTTGTTTFTSNGTTSTQENASAHPLFRTTLTQGNYRDSSNGSFRDANSTRYAEVFHQSGGTSNCTDRNYTFTNLIGNGTRRTYSGDAVAKYTGLGGQVTVQGTGSSSDATDNANVMYTEAQIDMDATTSIDVHTQGSAKITTTLEGMQTTGEL